MPSVYILTRIGVSLKLSCNVALDKTGYQENYFFLFLPKTIFCEYSLKVPWRGSSKEYSQCMFVGKKETKILIIPVWKKYLI